MLFARFRQAVTEQRMLVEAFFVFLGVAGLLTAIEFTYFAVQYRMIAAGYPVYHPETWLDAYIPFVPEFVWPYWAYFGYLGVAVWLSRSRQVLARLAGGLVGVHLFGFASYLLYPTAMQRIQIPCDTLSCDMVGAMYMLDPGFGLFPSLHAACSVYIMLATYHHGRHYGAAKRWFIYAFGAAIIAATVLIKQHYIVDVPAGIALGYFGGLLSWALVDRLIERGPVRGLLETSRRTADF